MYFFFKADIDLSGNEWKTQSGLAMGTQWKTNCGLNRDSPNVMVHDHSVIYE